MAATKFMHYFCLLRAMVRDEEGARIISDVTNVSFLLFFNHWASRRLKLLYHRDICVMSIGLKEVITVLPLQKPREKPWLRDNLEGQKTDSIRDVLEKFKEVQDRQSVASARPKKLDKIETDERTATCGLRGVPRESPGTWLSLWCNSNLWLWDWETRTLFARCAKT